MCGWRSLPLTANLKLDRKALPAPGGDAYGLRAYRSCEGGTRNGGGGNLGGFAEGRASRAADNFFSLGGHSLLAMQVIARLRKTLGVEVGINDVFGNPVLSDFARRVESARQSSLPRLRLWSAREVWPLSFAQQRLWFMAQMEGGSKAYSRSVGRAVAWQVG